jgi:predicted nuclease of restriction endonuclease-like (RecB) superfamily
VKKAIKPMKPKLLKPAEIEVMDTSFAEIAQMIESSRHRTYQAVNVALMDLYWQVGEYISRKLESAEWGGKVVEELARFLARTQPGLKGFTRPNLFRMKQFFEAYRDLPIVSALLRQLPWTHHLIILGQSKLPEEREFYIRMAIREKWSSRQLQRQFNTALFARTVLSPIKVPAVLAQTHPEALNIFRDSYILEFLNLPHDHSEADLHQGLIRQLKEFIIEMGRDFCFVGSEYPVQVGSQDFAIDLLFFHRGLNCLVAIELKPRRFKPEDLGKLNFYLEALDRDVRKEHERPSIGLLLCATKDTEVVEYCLSRSLSPAMIAEYETMLPDKEMLKAKLHELYLLLAPAEDDEDEEDEPAPKKKPKLSTVVREMKKGGRK